MKKNLLIAAALVVCATGVAQTQRQAAINRPIKQSDHNHNIESDAFPVAGTKAIAGPRSRSISHGNTSSVCTPVKFTSAVNAFAVGGGLTTYMQNCLSYNKDLNTVLWTSRISADWAFSGKTTGAIQATWANVNTLAWDSMIIYRDSANVHAGRYPGGVLFNPTGNTVISGAQMVGSGPITSNGTPAWVGEWYANRQPSGSYHSTNIPNMTNFASTGKAPFGTVGNSFTNNGFFNVDMLQAGQNVWVSGAMYDYASNANAKGAIFGKGSYSSGTFTWSADSVVPGFLSNAGGLMSDAEGARVAFDATGQIGYRVFNGRLSTTYNNSADSTMMPIVYKTTNGGNTWTLVLAGYDWSCQHPELLKYVGALLTTPARHITPNLQHGIDLTVDANGVLHYVTTLTMPFKDGKYVGGGFDSLQYTYTYRWNYKTNYPIIWDLMTDGSPTYGWKTMMVDSIITAYVGANPATDTTAAFSAWQNTSTFLDYGAHLTVSRSTDGKVVFYGWGDSDPTVTGTPFNTQPDMIMKAYDVTTNKTSAVINVTNGIGTCFFSYLSDISYYDGGTSSWVVPFVYTVGRTTATPGVYIGTNPVDFYYGKCASFNSTNVNIPAIVHLQQPPCFIGIKTNNNFFNSVNVYPNPFSNSTNIVVNLNEAKAININVFDAIGNVVFTRKTNGNIGENTIVFDGSSLTAGVYYYTVTAGYEKVTKKMIIQK
jgi:hypothetical protein